jgi:thiol:disulfide interchange protein DsbD
MLFLFALGMGFLLIIVGTFTGVLSSLPRSGAWMEKVKKGFGFLMLAIGEYFILKAGQLML